MKTNDKRLYHVTQTYSYTKNHEFAWTYFTFLWNLLQNYCQVFHAQIVWQIRWYWCLKLCPELCQFLYQRTNSRFTKKWSICPKTYIFRRWTVNRTYQLQKPWKFHHKKYLPKLLFSILSNNIHCEWSQVAYIWLV